MIHNTTCHLAGETIEVLPGVPEIAGELVEIEDWWDRVSGGSWSVASGNPVAMVYAIRAKAGDVPNDDEVVYAKMENVGMLLHISELEDAN
jgi:hypothetical protein